MSIRSVAAALAVVGLGCLITAPAAYAAEHVWSGGAPDDNWSSPANWSSGGPVQAGETVELVFPIGIAGRHTSNNDLQNVTVSQLTLHDGGYTITGKTITLMSLIGSCVIAPNCVSAADNVVSLPLVLASTPTIMADTLGAAPTLTLSGVISGSGSLSKLGAGVVSLTGANTYTGQTTVYGGTLTVASDAALGSAAGATNLSPGATLALSDGVRISAEPLSMDTATLQANGVVSWDGPIRLLGLNTVDIPSKRLATQGKIDGPGALKKTGSGSLTTLGQVGATTPPSITVQAGTLSLGNASTTTTVTVGTGAGLNVSRAVHSGTLLLGGGHLVSGQPGASWDGPIVLTADSYLELAVGADSLLLLNGPVDGAFSLAQFGGGKVVANSIGQIVPLANLSVNGELSVGQEAIASHLTLTSGSITGAGTVVLNGDVTVNTGSTPSKIATAMTLRGTNTTFTVDDGAADPDLLITGLVSSAASGNGLTKSVSGTMRLTAHNPYNGTTTLSAGTLSVMGRQPNSRVTVNGGILTGTGAVLGITTAGGVVQPGDPTGLLQAYDVTNLTGAAVAIAINGPNPADYGQLLGVVTLSDTRLAVTLGNGYAPSVGSQFTILPTQGGYAQGVQGTFTGLPEGAVFQVGTTLFQINYVNQTVVLTVVPTVSISGVTVTEGNGAPTHAVFTVALSGPSATSVTVQATTGDGTATAGLDYQAVHQTITFARGETSKQFSVPVIGDTAVEGDETFNVTLTNPTDAVVGTALAIGTILNDDIGASPTPPPATPTPLPAAPAPRPVAMAVTHTSTNLLEVTITTVGTLERIEWSPVANVAVDDAAGTPITGSRIVLPASSRSAVFRIRKLSGVSATLPLTLTGSFGTWQTFAGGGPNAW